MRYGWKTKMLQRYSARLDCLGSFWSIGSADGICAGREAHSISLYGLKNDLLMASIVTGK
jgi:hypothetical protein